MARWLHEKRRKHALGFIESLEKAVRGAEAHKARPHKPRSHPRAGAGHRAKT